MPDTNDEQEIKLIAEQITRYLRTHNNATDTLEGIAQWWLVQQRIYEERQRVQKALDYLCDQGLIRKRTLPNNTNIYEFVSDET